MTNLLNEKYGNALEIIEETGKLAMASIDDGDLGQLQEELKALGFESYIDTSTDYLIVEAGEEKRIMELIEKEFLTVEEMEELTNSAYVENWEHNGNSGAYNGYNWYVITVENEDYSVYEKSEF